MAPRRSTVSRFDHTVPTSILNPIHGIRSLNFRVGWREENTIRKTRASGTTLIFQSREGGGSIILQGFAVKRCYERFRQCALRIAAERCARISVQYRRTPPISGSNQRQPTAGATFGRCEHVCIKVRFVRQSKFLQQWHRQLDCWYGRRRYDESHATGAPTGG